MYRKSARTKGENIRTPINRTQTCTTTVFLSNALLHIRARYPTIERTTLSTSASRDTLSAPTPPAAFALKRHHVTRHMHHITRTTHNRRHRITQQHTHTHTHIHTHIHTHTYTQSTSGGTHKHACVQTGSQAAAHLRAIARAAAAGTRVSVDELLASAAEAGGLDDAVPATPSRLRAGTPPPVGGAGAGATPATSSGGAPPARAAGNTAI